MAASGRRKKLLLRGAAMAIVVAVIAVGLSNATALRRAASSGASPDSLTLRTVAPPNVANEAVAPAGAPAAGTPTPTSQSAAPTALPATASAAAGSANTLAPIIPAGETALGDGVIATRQDSGVVVFFDTPELRTRIPDKFERFLRATLPRIYGAAIEPFLASVPFGNLAGQGDLLNGLPTRGIQLPVQSGWRLDIYPETRPGRDGPLVIRYRTRMARR